MSTTRKARRLAALERQTAEELAPLRAEAAAERQREVDRRWRNAYGVRVPPAGDPVVAHERARAARYAARALADPDEAVSELEIARLVGDELGALGVAHVALQRGWSNVLAGFGQKFPERGRAQRELEEAQAAVSDHGARFSRALAERTPSLGQEAS